MSEPVGRMGGRANAFGFMAAVLLGAVGCQSSGSGLNLRSYKDPFFPDNFHAQVPDCAYRVDREGNLHVAGLAHTTFDSRGDVTQLLYVRRFWTPQPGKSYAHSSTMNATLTYVVSTADGTAVYRGSGFVYTTGPRLGGAMKIDIERAELRLDTTIGDAIDLLGDVRLTGRLHAEPDDHRVIDLTRQLQLQSAEPAPAISRR